MIAQSVLDQIQDRSDIVEVIQRYVPLKRAGRGFTTVCPFHSEKSPSFVVSPDKQIFHCFGCGVGGNVFSFVMKYEKLTFPETVRQLAQAAGILLEEDEEFRKKEDSRQPILNAVAAATEFFRAELTKMPAEAPIRQYIAKRRLTDEALSKFKIGYSPDAWDALLKQLAKDHGTETLLRAGLLLERDGKTGAYDRFRNRMMFPITDLKGRVIGFGARVLDDTQPKYLNSPETEVYHKGRVLYGFYEGIEAIRRENRVLIVEGYMDVIGCHEAGVEIAAAASGTSLTTDQIKAIKRFTSNVTVLFDADKAGEAATLRGLDLLVEENCNVQIAALPEGHDPDSFVKEFGSEKFKEALNAALPLFDYKYQFLTRKYDPRKVEGKVQISREMLATIRRIPNEITKDGYITELSRRLGISEDALKVELKKAASAPRVIDLAQDDRKMPPRLNLPVPAIEKLLIGLFLTDPRLWGMSRGCFSDQDFVNEDSRFLARMVLEANEWEEIQPARIMNMLRERESVSSLVLQAVHEAEIVEDTNRAFEDCLKRMDETRSKERLRRLREEIAACERANDIDGRNILLRELNETSRKGKPNGTEVQTKS